MVKVKYLPQKREIVLDRPVCMGNSVQEPLFPPKAERVRCVLKEGACPPSTLQPQMRWMFL